MCILERKIKYISLCSLLHLNMYIHIYIYSYIFTLIFMSTKKNLWHTRYYKRKKIPHCLLSNDYEHHINKCLPLKTSIEQKIKAPHTLYYHAIHTQIQKDKKTTHLAWCRHPNSSGPVVIEMRQFVGQSLHIIYLEVPTITEDNIVCGCHCALKVRESGVKINWYARNQWDLYSYEDMCIQSYSQANIFLVWEDFWMCMSSYQDLLSGSLWDYLIIKERSLEVFWIVVIPMKYLWKLVDQKWKSGKPVWGHFSSNYIKVVSQMTKYSVQGFPTWGPWGTFWGAIWKFWCQIKLTFISLTVPTYNYLSHINKLQSFHKVS